MVTAKEIARGLVYSDSPFNLRKNEAVIENVSYGMFSWGEADLIALTKSGYMIEGEIKISSNDILADLKKQKWKEESYKKWVRDIKKFYYCVPEELVAFTMENTNRAVIEVSVSESGAYRSRVVRDCQHGGGRKLFLEEKVNLLRLGCFRAWRT